MEECSHARTLKMLEEERGVNSVLLNAWDWWCYLIMDSILNQCIKYCDHKGPFENWSLTRKTDTGDVARFFAFSMREGKDSGYQCDFTWQSRKSKIKKGDQQFCFQRNLFPVEFCLSYTMQRGWAGDMHERKNQLLCDTVGCFLMFLNEQENETGP